MSQDDTPPPYAPSIAQPSYNNEWAGPSSHTWTNPVDNTSLELQQYRREKINLQTEVGQLRQQLQHINHSGGGNHEWLSQQNEDLHRQVAQLTQEVYIYMILVYIKSTETSIFEKIPTLAFN